MTATDVNTTVTRPNFSVVGRLFVHGPSGNVAVGDISTYNDTSGAPARKLEVDGSAMIRGDVVFHNSNGESSIVVLDSNANALTVKDAGASPITYWKINSDSQRLETHAPIHVLDTRIEAKDNDANGLQITAEAGNPIVTLDTTDSAENVKVAYPINARRDGQLRHERGRDVQRVGVGRHHRWAHRGEEDVHDGCVWGPPGGLKDSSNECVWFFPRLFRACLFPHPRDSSSTPRRSR